MSNRIILFRGKRVDNGEWVEGHYAKGGNGEEETTVILPLGTTEIIEVTPESVGQFTGRTNTKNQKLFEGDYVRWTHGRHYWEGYISTVFESRSNTLYIIETFHNCTSNEDESEYTFERSDSRKGTRNDIEYWSYKNDFEIIGTIHDTPE